MLMRDAVLAVGVAVLVLGRGAAEEPPWSAWRTDLEQAKQVARTVGKPLFVVFRCEH
jgi:hypothetical protein